jgi:hypothetical protein
MRQVLGVVFIQFFHLVYNTMSQNEAFLVYPLSSNHIFNVGLDLPNQLYLAMNDN